MILLQNGNRQGNFNNAPRCGARTRQGSSCKKAAMRGKRRCRNHGGASTGAPLGNTNALKYGFYQAASIEERKAINAFLSKVQDFLKKNDIK